MTGFAAHLRVYEPLGALPAAERSRVQESVAAGDAASRPVLMAREHAIAREASCASPPRVDVRAADTGAYIRHLDGLTYVCPWRLQVRVWEALGEFCQRMPDQLVQAFLPGVPVAAAEAAHEAWLADHPDTHVGIRTATWQVPLPWFVIFEADERRLVLGERRAAGAPPDTGLDRALVYLTAMSRARRRTARALNVVRRAFGEGAATDALEGVGRWLEDFHPHSLVELDYGGLVHLVDDETLAGDTSVADIAASLQALADGDVGAAGETYERVLTRWRSLAALEHVN